MPALADDDRDRVSLEDDALRHYLADATVLLDDEEVIATPVDPTEPDEMAWKAITRRVPRARRFDR